MTGTELVEGIAFDPNVTGERGCIRGTRVTVATVGSLLASRLGTDELVRD
jgi:uncharacterized protein (DUF433 family)